MRPRRLPRVLLAVASLLVVGLVTPVGRADPSDDAQRRYDRLTEFLGQSCQHDRECPSPLRCLDSLCAQPPAMSGEHDETTPLAMFWGGAGESVYYLEVADDAAERQRGLMHRPSMQDDWGMLFIYPNERPMSFWMQNTYIPLDMVFLDSDGMVVGVVEGAEPLTTVSRSVEGESQFVIELNAGQAAEKGIAAGTRCELLNLMSDRIIGADAAD